MSVDRIEPCPNRECLSGEVVIDQHPQILTSKAVRVTCLGCLMNGPLKKDESKAVAAWNNLPRGASATDFL